MLAYQINMEDKSLYLVPLTYIIGATNFVTASKRAWTVRKQEAVTKERKEPIW